MCFLSHTDYMNSFLKIRTLVNKIGIIEKSETKYA